MLNPCSPCVCTGAPCEQCMFGYRSREENHESMKKLFLAVEAGEKPIGWRCVENYKCYHPDWEKEFPSEEKDEKKEETKREPMKIQREVIVTIEASEMAKIIRDYLGKEGLETDTGRIEFKMKARTEGFGMAEHTTYEFDKCTAKCKIITERKE